MVSSHHLFLEFLVIGIVGHYLTAAGLYIPQEPPASSTPKTDEPPVFPQSPPSDLTPVDAISQRLEDAIPLGDNMRR
jgi:hypothetical protein